MQGVLPVTTAGAPEEPCTRSRRSHRGSFAGGTSGCGGKHLWVSERRRRGGQPVGRGQGRWGTSENARDGLQQGSPAPERPRARLTACRREPSRMAVAGNRPLAKSRPPARHAREPSRRHWPHRAASHVRAGGRARAQGRPPTRGALCSLRRVPWCAPFLPHSSVCAAIC